MKRVDLRQHNDAILAPLIEAGVTLLPNTSGAKTAEEAIFAAQLAREALGTHWLKLEIHPDARWLLPDPIETLKAAEALVKQGFVVLPYCGADPVLCKRLEEVGCAAVMPLGAPIGSNQGLETKAMLEIIIQQATVPVVGRRRDRRAQPRGAGAGNGRRRGAGQYGDRRGGRSGDDGDSVPSGC
ncbi:thiazole synthase [Salmonella enterica subsp. enterica]|nr:thiazole synthase [Salmonella enterica subsp. enterica]